MNEVVDVTNPKAEAAAFDYGGLAGDLAARAKETAGRIRSRTTAMQTAIMETGQELLWAKDALGHGNFLAWVVAEAGMSASTARRYMDVAENLTPKIVTVTNLPPQVLYALAAPTTPAAVRAEVSAAVEKGAPVDSDRVRYRITEARQARKAEIEASKKTPEARKRQKQKEERWRREREADLARYRADEAARHERALRAVDFLKEHLNENYAAFAEMLKGLRTDELQEAMKRS